MKKIKVVKQTLVIDNSHGISLIHIIGRCEDGDFYVMKSVEFDEDDSISLRIAEAINGKADKWGDKEFIITHKSEDFDCECCGSYSDYEIIITSSDNLKQTISIMDDNHMGSSTRGWSNEEVINDWKALGYDVEICHM